MKRITLIAALLAAAVTLPAQQKKNTPKIPAVAEIEQNDSNPFTEVRKVEGIDPSGMAVVLQGNMLYCGAGSKIYALDASEPMNPKILGTLEIAGYVRQITEQDGFLYVCSRETGAWIIDAHNPAKLKLLSRYDAIELATGIDVVGDVMFLSLRQNGVEFVDITDKSHPQHILKQKTYESQSSCYVNGVLYSGDWGNGALTVIEASDLSQEKLISEIKLEGFGDGVYAQGDRLYVSTGHHRINAGLTKEEEFGRGHALHIFDISNPREPKLISTTRFGKLYARGNDFWTPRPNADGSVIFCADTFNGLYAVDAASAKTIGHIVFKIPGDKPKRAVCSSVAVGNGVIYATSLDYGLAAIACPKASFYRTEKGAAPLNPGYRAHYETAPDSHFTAWMPDENVQVKSVAAYGDFLYAACSDGGLIVLKGSKDGEVKPYGRGPSKYAGDVAIRGNMLYVAEGNDGVAIYRLERSGASMSEFARQKDFRGKMSGLCLWVWAPTDDFVVVSDRNAGYVFLESDELKAIWKYKDGPGWDKYVSNEACKGKMYPIIIPNKGFRWIDLSEDFPKLTPKNTVDQPVLSNGVCNYKDKAILVCDGQIKVLKPGQEANEDKTKWAGWGKGIKGAPVYDGKARLGITYRIGRSVSMYDFKDEANPVLLWKENTIGNPEVSIFWKGRLVVPCGYQGLLIEK